MLSTYKALLRTSAPRVALLVAATALVASGCGDSDGGNTNPGGNVAPDTGGNTDVTFSDTTSSSSGGSDASTSSSGSTDTGTSSSSGATDTGASSSSGATDTGSSSGAIDAGSSSGSDAGAVTGTCVGKCGKYTSGASCQCDQGCSNFKDCCPDYEKLCKKPGTDAGSSSGADAGSSSGGGDVTTTPTSCEGKCGKYIGGAPCQCNLDCGDFGDCCADFKKFCAKPECSEDKDCDDQLTCTADTCDKAKGKCEHKLNDKSCLIDKTCIKAGESGTKACQVCDPDKVTDDWTVNSGGTCDDGNSCTESDTCNDAGQCVGAKKASCCSKDGDCSDGGACKTGTCDIAKGTCSYKDKADCCAAGACCDLAENKVKKAATQCGKDVKTEQYKCDGDEIQSRQAYDGCDGTKATCGTDKANYHWTAWKTVVTCEKGAKCVQKGSGKPKCESPTQTCKGATDCDDNNTCTKDICSGGKCSHEVVAGCCNFPSDCDDSNMCTVDLCEQNKCSNTAPPCKGSSDCELASCDPKTGKCNVKIKAGFCKIDDACVANGKLKSGDTCSACDYKKSQTTWTPAAKCACKTGVCCDATKGQIKPQGAQCEDKAKAREYRCKDKGNEVEVREAFRGCTGKSNTCSTSSKNYHWAAWKSYKKCAAAEFCEVADQKKPGVCKKKVTPQCKAGTTCCTSAGKFAAQKTACSKTVVRKQYKCSSTTAKSAKIEVREAVRGCTGKSQTCSSASANLAWGSYKTLKTCTSSQTCKPGTFSFLAPTCVTAQQCKPGTTCCDTKGFFSAKKTKCGSISISSKYTCSSNNKGSDVLRARAYGGCTGTSTGCSYKSDNWHWAKPALYRNCLSPQQCAVSNPSIPGICASGSATSCTKTDKWEAGTTTSKAVSIGSFNDNSASKVLTPKMHFKSTTDIDFLKYKLNDTSSSYRPVVHVEWSAPAAMNLCAWVSCDKGTGGKNCKALTCPTGFKSQQNSSVSGEKLNGCCTSTWKASGTLHLEQLATSGSNHGGWVYFSGRNAAPICQEANIKLVFGKKISTPCKPGTTCCTSTGQISKKSTKCSSLITRTEYTCSGNKVMRRRAYRGCTGSSAFCSFLQSNWHWTGWSTYKSCTTSQVCSVSDKTKPGTCVTKSDAVCKLTDKYASGGYYTTAYYLGGYSDSSSAKVMAPDVIFNSKYDSEYFRYRIKDSALLTDPKVHIEWEGADNVLTCAYYRCDKGASGKNCAPVKCPAGTSPSWASYVSGVNPNGCCMTAKKGTLAFSPDTPGSFDESGWVYFRMHNTGKVCQKVKTKLVFGSKQSTQCKPGTACCTGSGSYAAKGTKCKTTVLASEYACSSSLKGGDVRRRQAFHGCTGSSTTCSSSTAYRHWSSWSTYKNCSTSQVCSVPDKTKPGTCKAATNPLCSKTDKYAAANTYASAYNLGAYNDTSSAKFMSPKVLFNSTVDAEYFRYTIKDGFNLTDPRVHVEWTGSDKVTVCAYYRCHKGSNSKDCKPVKCPAGSLPSNNFYVSSAKPNGCCATAAKGKMAWTPDATGNDETGTAYLRFYNASSVCQEVSVKLQFGSQSSTQCNPKDKCCQADGSYAKKGTKCGATALATEYGCSSATFSGNVLKRQAFSGCTGVSGTFCSSATSNRHWTNWATHKNCTSKQICSVPDKTKEGQCKDAGSSADICKKADAWESGTFYTSAKSLGTFQSNAKAIMVTPDMHMKSTTDNDYIKWAINDGSGEPRVRVAWTAAESVRMCAYYACNSGKNGKNCAKVKCNKGTPSWSPTVSGTNQNGCCAEGKKAEIDFTPDAPGSLNETGWAYLRVQNKAKICQYINTKVSFAGSTTVCGDGINGFLEGCKQDQGTCAGKCGAKYDSGKPCQCDSACVAKKDCCWDHNLYCSK